jgi:hypothetical protein
MPGFTQHDINPDFCKKDPPLPENLELFYKFEHVGIPFVTSQGSRFISTRWGDGGSQTTPLHYPAIRLAAIHQFIEEHGVPPREASLRNAFRAFCAKANSDWRAIHPRIGLHEGAIHIDPFWRAPSFAGKHIVVTAKGWRTRTNQIDTILPPTASAYPPIDPAGNNGLTFPVLEQMRHLLRLDNDQPAWLRVLVWLLAAFRPPASPDAPRDLPILQISGPPSSGKTTAARFLRSLVDPSDAPITFTPSTEAAAGRIARDNHVVFIDGTTRLNRRPAELLARLSTGLPAKFHGDIQNLSRPIILTINEEGAADRLAHRVLPVDLPPLTNPLPPDELRAQFEALRPSLVAALLTLLSTALRRLPDTPCPQGARFPEAAQWAAAAFEGLDLNELVCVTQPQNPLEAKLSSVITGAGGTWKGTATQLVAALDSHLSARAQPDETTYPSNQPRAAGRYWPKALSQKLKQISIICVTTHRTNKERTLTLTRLAHASHPDPGQVNPGQVASVRPPAVVMPSHLACCRPRSLPRRGEWLKAGPFPRMLAVLLRTKNPLTSHCRWRTIA